MGSEVAPVTGSATARRSIDLTLSPAAKTALARGVPDSTRDAYARDWKDFEDWCVSVGRTPLPATAETLAEYATQLAYGDKPRSPATIERARSSIRSAHRTAGAPVPDTLGLATVLKGYRAQLAEAKDPRARQQQATAATKNILEAILEQVDRASPAGRRDTSLILLGFCVAGRRSEVAALDIPDIIETEEGLTVSVYRRKTRKHQDVTIPYAQDPNVCAVLAMKEWLEFLAKEGRTDGPLFIRINRHGQLGPQLTRNGRPIGDPSGRITGEAVSDVIKGRARAAALSGKWSGHSVRRGFATAARQAGHDQIRIARDGGWDDHSRMVARYIADADRWEDNALKGVL